LRASQIPHSELRIPRSLGPLVAPASPHDNTH